MADQYFVAFVGTHIERLLRRREGMDSIFRDGAWHPTDRIMEYMVGDDMDVDEVTEKQARGKYPEAFA